MTPDYHSDNFATARLEDTVSLRSAAREARATLYAVLNRLELNCKVDDFSSLKDRSEVVVWPDARTTTIRLIDDVS